MREDWEDINEMLYFQYLLYVPKIINIDLISRHHDNPLAGHLGIKKTQKLVAQKYYQSTFRHNVEAYIQGCDICLASKVVGYKLYEDLQSLPMPTYCWKDLSIDFIIGLSISTNLKDDSYDSILVIINWPTKIIYYEVVKITINALDLAQVVLDVAV